MESRKEKRKEKQENNERNETESIHERDLRFGSGFRRGGRRRRRSLALARRRRGRRGRRFVLRIDGMNEKRRRRRGRGGREIVNFKDASVPTDNAGVLLLYTWRGEKRRAGRRDGKGGKEAREEGEGERKRRKMRNTTSKKGAISLCSSLFLLSLHSLAFLSSFSLQALCSSSLPHLPPSV
jgi:hypothetical protein